MLTTKNKIRLAKIVNKLVIGLRTLIGKGPKAIVQRKGLYWSLDLNEGIDLAIYLLGGFELDTRKAFKRIVQPGMTVVDIGANIGAHTLPLAEMVGNTGRVISIEPTDWAFRKLQENLKLNPQLINRVTAVQAMLVGSDNEDLPSSIYSSWPLTATEASDDFHPIHLGRLMSTEGTTFVTLDNLMKQLDVRTIDVIKMDVDGFELGVIKGALKVIDENKNMRIIMELAPYLFNNEKDELGELLSIFHNNGLVMSQLDSGTLLPTSPLEMANLLPHGASMNVLVYRLSS